MNDISTYPSITKRQQMVRSVNKEPKFWEERHLINYIFWFMILPRLSLLLSIELFVKRLTSDSSTSDFWLDEWFERFSFIDGNKFKAPWLTIDSLQFLESDYEAFIHSPPSFDLVIIRQFSNSLRIKISKESKWYNE